MSYISREAILSVAWVCGQFVCPSILCPVPEQMLGVSIIDLQTDIWVGT